MVVELYLEVVVVFVVFVVGMYWLMDVVGEMYNEF